MPFHEPGMPGDVGLMLFPFGKVSVYPGKYVSNRLIGIASDAVQERVTGLNIQFDGRDAGSILATVMLLFHEQVELVQAVQHRSIFL